MSRAEKPEWHAHRGAELTSIALHRRVAEKIARDPAVVDDARRRVAGWRRSGGPVRGDCVRRWEELLAGPASDLCDALVADTEEMRDLRQNTPFAGALAPRERWDVIRAVKEEAESQGGS